MWSQLLPSYNLFFEDFLELVAYCCIRSNYIVSALFMNARNARIKARQLLIISPKLSSRRLIEILSNPTDDKRWKVVTILIGSY